MKPDYVRLLKAADSLRGWKNPAEVASMLTKHGYEVSEQMLTNWKTRGVSNEGRLKASRIIGCRPHWIETGDGDMTEGGRSQPGSKSPGVSARSDQTESPTKGYIGFELLDIHAAAGGGAATTDFPEVVEHVNVLEDWARKALGGDLSRVRLISARGTSMEGTIENGDVLFVDVTVREFDGDGLYIIARSGDIQVKRLQKLHGNKLAVISDNPRHKTEELEPQQANEVVICGRVLAAWTLKRFW